MKNATLHGIRKTLIASFLALGALLPVDNGGARQFRGIATGTKKGEAMQVCHVWTTK